MAANQTLWEKPDNPEPKAWTLANTIMAGLIALIGALLLLGFNAQNNKIEVGDRLIREEIATGNKAAMDQIKEIKDQYSQTSNQFLNLAKDVARIDANQAARMKKEEIEQRNGQRK